VRGKRTIKQDLLLSDNLKTQQIVRYIHPILSLTKPEQNKSSTG